LLSRSVCHNLSTAYGLDETTNIDHEHNEGAICNAHFLHVD